MRPENAVNILIGLFNLFTGLGSSQHDFATCEDEEHYLGLYEAEDQAREGLRMVITRILFTFVLGVSAMEKVFKADSKASVH
jgi:hypothetical protein